MSFLRAWFQRNSSMVLLVGGCIFVAGHSIRDGHSVFAVPMAVIAIGVVPKDRSSTNQIMTRCTARHVFAYLETGFHLGPG